MVRERKPQRYEVSPAGGSILGSIVGTVFVTVSSLNLLGLLEVNGQMRTPESWLCLPMGFLVLYASATAPRTVEVSLDGSLVVNRFVGSQVIRPSDVVSLATKWESGYDDVYLAVIVQLESGKLSIPDFTGAEEFFTNFARRSRRIDISKLDFSLPKSGKGK